MIDLTTLTARKIAESVRRRELTAVAVIAYGAALVMSSGSVRQMYMLRGQALIPSRSTRELLAGQMASGSAGVHGMTAISVTMNALSVRIG